MRVGTLSGRLSKTQTSRLRCGHVGSFFKNLADSVSQFLEVQAQHAFIRDESSKGRWDAALTRSLFIFMMEVFERTVGRDLGERADDSRKMEHVC